jgi:FkbM family methyltransferase
VSALSAIAMTVDQLGFRRPLSWLATLAYVPRSAGRQRFFVDADGHWVNRQPEATIVSPVVHTTTYAAFRGWVLDNWCWQYLPQPGDTVVDVGAGIGEEAVIFSSLVGPSGRVISIEAHPDTFACLQGTIRGSHLDNVIPICAALSEADGSAFIADIDSHLASSIITESGGTKVQARSLDSLLQELGIGTVALLKMNIEGAERLAVRGMVESARRVANVCISCHDFVAERGGPDVFRTKAEVVPLLKSFGYSLIGRPDHSDPWVRDYLYGSLD